MMSILLIILCLIEKCMIEADPKFWLGKTLDEKSHANEVGVEKTHNDDDYQYITSAGTNSSGDSRRQSGSGSGDIGSPGGSGGPSGTGSGDTGSLGGSGGPGGSGSGDTGSPSGSGELGGSGSGYTDATHVTTHQDQFNPVWFKKTDEDDSNDDESVESDNSEGIKDPFNCPKKCGIIRENLGCIKQANAACTAYKNDKKCSKEEVEDNEGGTDCNIANDRMVQPRIKYLIERIPWLVLLIITTYDESDQTMCGGSLINDRFILTAAHCLCMEHVGHCTRPIGKVEKEQIKIKDDVKTKQMILAYVGVTSPKEPSPKTLLGEKRKSEEIEKLFIHPDLSTTEEFSQTPDIMLVKIKPIHKFSDNVRPICLAHGDVHDVPPCSDDSVDGDSAPEEEIKQYGGCGTVAGWGARYDPGKEDTICVTDNSFAAPAKRRLCHDTKDKCSTVNIKDKLMSRNCKYLKREMEYQRKQNTHKYTGITYDQLASKAPIIILVGKMKKKTICGKTNFEKERQDRKWNGWCATKLDSKDKIEEYGFCTDRCKDNKETVQALTVNLMTDEECETLTDVDDKLDPKREMCGGKKTFFPDFNKRVFKRLKKSEKTREREKKEYKGGKVKPTKYSYKYIPSTHKNYTENFKLFDMKAMTNNSEEYKYKWFLGGRGACQVNSGGPLWRMMGVGYEKRAVLIGVVARGKGCDDFNKPGIFSKVKANYDFIKKIVGKESKGACRNYLENINK